MKSVLAALLLTMVGTACSSDNSGQDCESGKCDTPGGSIAQQCAASRVSAMDEKRPHFTPAGVRWSCRDVNGVTANTNTKDDRGQEYCEYFSMLHTSGIPAVISNDQGPVFCDASTPCAQGTCDDSISSCVSAKEVDLTKPADILGKNLDAADAVTPLDPVLSAGQLEWMAQNPTQKVGECVFTSWHNDIDMPVTSSETIGGYGLNATSPGTSNPLFKMIVQFNANSAAKALVHDCLVPGKKSIKDGFLRACTFAGTSGAGVPWRKSDPSVCTMAMKIAECGCSVTLNDGSNQKLDLTKDEDLQKAEELFVPTARRGFTLGTWDGIGQLPTGCRFVKTGAAETYKINGLTFNDPNADQNIVTCDLKAAQVTSATAKDPKEACRSAYGDEVVVHVRAPDPSIATLSCDTTKPQCKGVPWDLGNL